MSESFWLTNAKLALFMNGEHIRTPATDDDAGDDACDDLVPAVS